MVSLIGVPDTPYFTLWMQWQWIILFITILISISSITLMMCACCAARRRKKRLEELQQEADEAVLPPPDLPSQSTIASVTERSALSPRPKPATEREKKKTETKKPLPGAVSPKKQPAGAGGEVTVFVAPRNVAAYRTMALGLADSAIFDDFDGTGTKTTTFKPSRKAPTKPQKTTYAPNQSPNYRTLALAESRVFDSKDKTMQRVQDDDKHEYIVCTGK